MTQARICIYAGSEAEGSEVQISRLLQILREFAADPILSDYVIDAVWQGMEAIKAIFTVPSLHFLKFYGLDSVCLSVLLMG